MKFVLSDSMLQTHITFFDDDSVQIQENSNHDPNLSNASNLLFFEGL